MKTLITGGAGFIGSHTADLLLHQGYGVRILDGLEPPVHPQRTKPDYLSDEVEFILGDVRNRDEMEKALQGVEVVFHLAAYQDYLTDFSRFAFVNEGGTALLYEIIVNGHLPIQKVILGSSQAVYGEGKYWCAVDGNQYPLPRSLEELTRGEWEIRCPICGQNMQPVPTNESKVNPHNQYAISKYCQELYALNLGRRYNIPTVALRYSITQGPRQSFFNAYSGILRTFALCLLNGVPPTIYEDGQQLRDYVYVGDVAKANLLVMERDAADYQVFNVGGNKAITVLEYASLLLNLMDKDIKPESCGEFRFGDTRHIISDIAKLQSLGWEPEASVEQIAREYLAWAEAQPGVADYYAAAAQEMEKKGVLRRQNVGEAFAPSR
jgi:dTDP-L-rhamnose 4-epimerase